MKTKRKALLLTSLLAIGISALARNKEAPLESQLNAEFLGKSFYTRILFGTVVTVPLTNGGECYQLVETEYHPDGSVRYQSNGHCYSNTGTRMDLLNPWSQTTTLQPEQFAGTIRAGTQVTVRKIELKNDHIEFQLWSNPNSRSVLHRANLRLFVTGGTKDLTADNAIAAAAEVLYIEKYEKLRELTNEFTKLSEALPALQSQYSDVTLKASQRAQVGHTLHETLQKLITNRSSPLLQSTDQAAIQKYNSQLTALDSGLPALDAAAKSERIQSIRSKLAADEALCVGLKAQLSGSKPVRSAELEEKVAKLKQYQDLLAEKQAFASQLFMEGEPTQDLKTQLAAESRELAALNDSLEMDRKRTQLDQLNMAFEQMKKRKVALVDHYTRAFGTAQERSALQALIGHMQSMLQNREQAKVLGSSTAAKEASQIETEVEKYKRR